MAQASAQRPTSVSQIIDDDECGSFIVVHRWTNDTVTPTPTTETQVKEQETTVRQEAGDELEGDEQFSDAAADLGGSAETLAEEIVGASNSTFGGSQWHYEDKQLELKKDPSHVGKEEPGGKMEVGSGTADVSAKVNGDTSMSLITLSQEGALMIDDEPFSMTNYSTASSSSDQQLEELQTKLSQVIGDHRGLLDLMEKQNLELEQRKMTIEELKLLANESVLREKEKSEASRKIVEKVTGERDLAIQQLQSLEISMRTPVNAPGSEALETLAGQVKQQEQIIKQNDEQIIELSTRLHQEIVKREELNELLRMKEEEDKVKSDSLSSSDEALARSLSDMERMEQTLENDVKVKGELQQEIANLKEQMERTLENAVRVKGELQQEIVNLKEQLETVTSENTRVHGLCQKLDAQCATMDTESREMRIKWAALEAEKERQIAMFNQEVSKNQALEEEKLELQRDMGRLSEMLQVRTAELHDLQMQTQGGNPMTGSLAGNLFGGFFKKPLQPSGVAIPPGARSYGMRDANDDPNEPFYQEAFQHVGAHAVQSNQSVEVPAVHLYQCPICLKRFDDLRKLEFHASNCGVDNATNTDPFVFP